MLDRPEIPWHRAGREDIGVICIMAYIEELESFLKFAYKARKEYEDAIEQVRKIDLATQDILHAVELEEHSNLEYIRLSCILKDLRKERRKAKDKQAMLKPLVDVFNKHTQTMGEFGRALGEMRKFERGMGSRQYDWRTDIVKRTLGHQEEIKATKNGMERKRSSICRKIVGKVFPKPSRKEAISFLMAPDKEKEPES